ncbi:MAG: DUF2442 domain-containing protein [Alphaproteobacteria bacterium]|nr:DUF2442 domain-containing protein [Alphaproteobacteria bacterium]
MTKPRILRATPRPDFTVAIDWSDGVSSVLDMRPEIARGGVYGALAEPAVFLRRLFVQANGESLAWEVFGNLVDLHADGIRAMSRAAPNAA